MGNETPPFQWVESMAVSTAVEDTDILTMEDSEQLTVCREAEFI